MKRGHNLADVLVRAKWRNLTGPQKAARVIFWVTIPMAVAGGIAGAYFAGHAKGYDAGVDMMNEVPQTIGEPIFENGKQQTNEAVLPTNESTTVKTSEDAYEFGKNWADAVNSGKAKEGAFESALENSDVSDEFASVADAAFRENLNKENKEEKPAQVVEENTEEKANDQKESHKVSNVSDLSNSVMNDEFTVVSDGITFTYKDGVFTEATIEGNNGETITAEIVDGKVSNSEIATVVSSVTGANVSEKSQGVENLAQAVNDALEKLDSSETLNKGHNVSAEKPAAKERTRW